MACMSCALTAKLTVCITIVGTFILMSSCELKPDLKSFYFSQEDHVYVYHSNGPDRTSYWHIFPEEEHIMKTIIYNSNFNEQQIITILKEAETGIGVADLCRRHGMGQSTFFKWKSKYSGLEVSELRRIKQLEEENRRLKMEREILPLDVSIPRRHIFGLLCC